MPELYFENTTTGTRWKIKELNKEAGTITLVGKHDVPFTEEYNVERFKRMGYVLKQAEAAPPPPPAA